MSWRFWLFTNQLPNHTTIMDAPDQYIAVALTFARHAQGVCSSLLQRVIMTSMGNFFYYSPSGDMQGSGEMRVRKQKKNKAPSRGSFFSSAASTV